MKKILLLFTVAGLLTLTGCNNDDDVIVTEDNDTIAENFEVSNVNFNTNNVVNSIVIPLDPQIFTSDMVLVYRLSGVDAGNDVWEPLPTTYNFNDGASLSYYFDFSIDKVVVYLESDFNLANEPGFTQNQVFRVLIIPAYLSASKKAVNFKDYNAVVKAYGIEEKDIKKISL